MNPERWHQVDEVLQAALDLPPARRIVFLREACAYDQDLLDEVTSLVSAHEAAADFIEQSAFSQDSHLLLGEDTQLNVGQNVGPYEIITPLGSGGMCEVYLAKDLRLNRLVALKILPAYFVTDHARLSRFQTEARAASALNHPNILTIHEVGELDGVHFIATEFIDGQTVRDLIRKEQLSIVEVLDIAIQVCSALMAAHTTGIVHRDIKPENIMRRSDGLVKILDFGIAKLLEQPSHESRTINHALTEMGMVLGTVGYMSPEQARGQAIDQRTDIWSLGVVLYEMLAYRAPFSRATRMDTMVEILEREPAPLLPPNHEAHPAIRRLQTILDKTLRKEKRERYQTSAELFENLSNVRQQLSATPISVCNSTLELMRRHRQALLVDNVELVSSVDDIQASRKATDYGRRFMVICLVILAAGIAAVLLYRQAGHRKFTTSLQAASATRTKLYSELADAEQLRFIEEQEQRISTMMGERPVKLETGSLREIKKSIDRYVARKDSVSNKPGEDALNTIYERSIPLVPVVSRAFEMKKIPVVVGIYLPMIESEYRPCLEVRTGAKGLFQFLPSTAKYYGVAPGEMCEVDKMAPAAAHYIADRMAELGEDSATMTLVLLSYHRGSQSVLESLRRLRETDNYARNFWTLYANRDQLDESFPDESGSYVPTFFAAAIIGENPASFGLTTPALSTLAKELK